MDETLPLHLADLRNRTDEQVDVIRNVLAQVKPVQFEILGEETVTAISKGENFEAFGGGRHINFMETITVLSGIATIIQLAMVIIQGLRNKPQSNEQIELKEEAKRIVTEKISCHTELSHLKELIANDPTLLAKVVSLLLTEKQAQKPA